MCGHGNTREVRVPRDGDFGDMVRRDIDSCLASVVEALVLGGVATQGACCGHGKCNGEILLADGRVLVVEPDRSAMRDRGARFRAAGLRSVSKSLSNAFPDRKAVV